MPPPTTVAVGGRNGLRDRLGAGGERGQLEHAHGPVPEHGAGVADGGGERLGRVRADIQALPARLDPRGGHGPPGLLADLAGHDHVGRQQHRLALALGPGQQGLDGVDLVGLEQRVADPVALGGQEGEAHAAAHDQAVDPAEEVVEHLQLVETLLPPSTAVNGRSGSSSSRDSSLTSPASR